MLFLEAERGNHFTIFTNPAISDVRSAIKLANLQVLNTGMTSRTYSKIEFLFRFCFIQTWLKCRPRPSQLTINCNVFQYYFLIYIIVELYQSRISRAERLFKYDIICSQVAGYNSNKQNYPIDDAFRGRHALASLPAGI